MHVLSVQIELHVPEARSLKQKRSTIKPILEGTRRRFGVSVAEVDHQNKWQRASIGIAVVASSHRHAVEVIDQVEAFVWSFTDVHVMQSDRTWLEAS